ncbi:radical SAM protein [candidate division KSB1 bacterium]|nr:radical SAM protein [candidate division KSB1 bacterium]
MPDRIEKHIELADAEILQEFKRISRFFDVRLRTTPAPYFPGPEHRLSEKKLIAALQGQANAAAQSVYLHIPFCDGRCLFCDLYSFNVPVKHRAMMEDYVQILAREINAWGRLLTRSSGRTTTIHFGGGSPMFLSHGQIEHLLTAVDKIFPISADTEIAVEITSSQLTDDNIKFFNRMNIRRIHVGVQTLSDPIRKIIGRREPADTVRQKVKMLTAGKFITSVDMLYGLPLQSMELFLSDLDQCIEWGVDGFALYELNLSPRMRRLMAENQRLETDKVQNYFMLLAGNKKLNRAGYGNVFFTHYGNQRDHNLYATYPIRGEDGPAFGTIADGQHGRCFFRHKKYKPYQQSVLQGGLGIDYGYVEDDHRRGIRLFEDQLMSTHINSTVLQSMTDQFGVAFSGMWDFWLYAGLVEKAEQGGGYVLTGSGCYLLANMLAQVRRLQT